MAARSPLFRGAIVVLSPHCRGNHAVVGELCGPAGLGGGRRGGTGEGRLDRGQLAITAWRLIAVDGDQLWTGKDAVAQSWDDVIVEEHHGATTSSRSGGEPGWLTLQSC
jgi:hypothetical protein